jgi:hypothetical protein
MSAQARVQHVPATKPEQLAMTLLARIRSVCVRRINLSVQARVRTVLVGHREPPGMTRAVTTLLAPVKFAPSTIMSFQTNVWHVHTIPYTLLGMMRQAVIQNAANCVRSMKQL